MTLSDYYFAFVDRDKDLMMALPGHNENRPIYQTAINPIHDKSLVWTIEENGGKYALKNLELSSGYMYQSQGSDPWNFQYNELKTFEEAANLSITLDNGTYTLSGVANMGIGPWNGNNADNGGNSSTYEQDAQYYIDGMQLAGNKVSGAIGHWYIYYISKTTYEKLVQDNVYLKNGNFMSETEGWECSTDMKRNQNNGEMRGLYYEHYQPTNAVYVRQSVTGLAPGNYTFSARTVSRYMTSSLYVKINGTEVAKVECTDDTKSRKEVTFNYATGSLEVGYTCSNPGDTGARWFAIDDAMLVRNGDVTSEMDLTFMITNPDFQANNWWSGWNGTGSDKTKEFVKGENNKDNFPNTVFAEMYGTTLSAKDLNQTINNLPKGVYQLSAKMVAGLPCYLYVKIGEKEQTLTYHGPVAIKSLTFVVSETSNVQIGYKHNGGSSNTNIWIAVDDFKLKYVGPLTSGTDFTSRIAFADCSSVTGWQGSPSLQNNENFEKFNTDFDVYQEITALPAGWYKVQAQAFDRTTNEAATYGVETALKRAVLYAGDATTLIKGIYEYASDTRLTTGENEETTNNDKWMPNTPAAGDKYFKVGWYDNEVLVYHKGGDLRIGIKKLAQAGNDWCLFDNFRLTYMGNELTENTVMTQYIDDPSFESGTLDYWKAGSTSGGDTGAKLNNNGTYTMSSCDGNYLYNTWGVTPLSVEQTISGLIQGVYSLKAVLAADQNSVITLAMGNASVEATMAGAKGNGQETTLTSIIVREGEDVLLKVSSGTWFKADDFRLTYLRPATDEEIITDAQNSLKALVATANAVDKTTNVGDAIFQIPTSAVTTFNTAITESQTYSEATHTTAEYDAQRATLQAAIDEFKTADYNGPATDTRYVITNVSDSYAHKGNAITFVEGARNDMGLYGIKYLTPANSAYAQAFIVTPVAGKRRTYTLHQIDRDDNARYLCVGAKYSDGINQQVRTTITAADAEEYRIDCIKEGVYGVYSIAGGSYMGNTQDNNDTYITNEGGKYHMSVAVAQKESVTLAVSNVHWATFIAPFPVDITGMEGLEAYTVAVGDEGLETTVVDNTIPANTPVLLYKNTSETFTKILTEYGTAKQQYYTVGNLVGNIGAASVIPVTEGKTNYLLQKQDNKLGFYKIDAGNIKSLKVGKDRAYLQMDTPAANAKEAFLFEDVPTDIGSLQTIDELLNGADIYDLSGKKHNRLQKGINIVNGKKIVLK